MEWEALIRELEIKNIAYALDENVASRSCFKIGGRVRLAAFPDTREKLVATLEALRKSAIRHEIIGNASNMLFAFDLFDGVFVFTGGVREMRIDGEHIYADCGASLIALSKRARDNSLTGFEFAYGIPGLVGGSVYMNAGAYGSEMSSVLEFSDAFDMSDGSVKRIKDHAFDYRNSIYMQNENLVCLGAQFCLARGDVSLINALMEQNMASRREKQPIELPSAGSYFKRPHGSFAGKLIEDCGLKGERIGDAEVSPKHAGFIVNRGSATYTDVLALEEKIKEIVMERFGVELEREVRLIK